MARPGCVLRGALIAFGLLFLPMGLWFAYKRFWGEALALIVIGGVFLRMGTTKDENSWMAAIDELDGSRGGTRDRKGGGLNE